MNIGTLSNLYGKSIMNKISHYQIVLSKIKENKKLFYMFEKVYVFGSILYKNTPNDLDLLVVYNNQTKQHVVSYYKAKIVNTLNQCIDLEVHCLAMSEKEILESQFLNHIINYNQLFLN